MVLGFFSVDISCPCYIHNFKWMWLVSDKDVELAYTLDHSNAFILLSPSRVQVLWFCGLWGWQIYLFITRSVPIIYKTRTGVILRAKRTHGWGNLKPFLFHNLVLPSISFLSIGLNSNIRDIWGEGVPAAEGHVAGTMRGKVQGNIYMRSRQNQFLANHLPQFTRHL